MSATTQKTKNAITLKGSAKIVSDYLSYGINSILYIRGIYPPESFTAEEHFGLPIHMSTDERIKEFLNTVLTQIREWLVLGKLEKLSLVITNVSNKEVLERWDFKLQYEQPANGEQGENGEPIGTKELKLIQNEIRDILRQICCSVTFLPLLDCPCAFDLLIFTKKDIEVPDQWGETQPCFIANSEEILLRSFSTSLHRMDTVVSYKGEPR